MNYMIETLMSSQLPQGKMFKLTTDKGYWFIANIEEEMSSQDNYDDFTEQERIIRYSFNIKVPAYIISSNEQGKPSPFKRYFSAVDISFSFENMKFTCIAEADMSSWAIAYPSINLRQEIAKAEEWCKANPDRAKPKKLWRKFLTNWFNKANDSIDNKRAYQSMNGKKVGYGIATGEYDNVF